MKEIILGIKDYMHDCRHDKGYSNKTPRPEYLNWKEGNVWHYIRQRRIAKAIKNRRCAG